MFIRFGWGHQHIIVKVCLLSNFQFQIDKTMMDELKEVKKALNPTEVLLVVDAMTGQEAAGMRTLTYTLQNC